MKTPVWLTIPMNLNFRSILLFSNPKECSSYESIRCPEYSLCYSNLIFHTKTVLPLLISRLLQILFFFESRMWWIGYLRRRWINLCIYYCKKWFQRFETFILFLQPRTPHTSYRYGRDALSSSQIMLIGFFALNGSFIGGFTFSKKKDNFWFTVFFLILSLCSAGLFYRCPFYAKNSNASRHTFIRYLRWVNMSEVVLYSK